MNPTHFLLDELPNMGVINVIPRFTIVPASKNYQVKERSGSISYRTSDKKLHLLHFHLINGLTTKNEACIFDAYYLGRLALDKVRQHFAGICATHGVEITQVQFDPIETGLVDDL